MNYNFTSKQDYIKFLSNLREGDVGEQSTIYFDDRNNRVIKVFSLEDQRLDSRKKELKLIELMKLNHRFPTAALPEAIIKLQGRCMGYVMPNITNAKSLGKIQFLARKKQIDVRENLEIACKLARFIENLHSEGIVFGDFHPNQFMIKDKKIYVCDTDTWGFIDKGKDYEADRAGRPKYVDPRIRDFSKEGFSINAYTKESDYFSLAVIIFEMLVGFSPYDGIYPLAKGFERDLRALNRISILGNHGLKDPNSFKMEHVAWMSEGLQSDFMQIFEGNKRFNILPSLENQAKDLKKCRKKHYYNTSRYSKCPCCRNNDSSALKEFRNYNINKISYDRYGIFDQKSVKKIVNFSTILDNDNNVVHLKENGSFEKISVSGTEEVFFTDTGIVKVSRIGKFKQFFSTLFGKFNDIYAGCSFGERMKRCRDANDPVCKLEVLDANEKILYSTMILKLSSTIKMEGNHLFYLRNRKELVDVYMTKNGCRETIINEITNPFIYEVNNLGYHCLCSINSQGILDISINGQTKYTIINEVPTTVKYDYVSKKWCVITKMKNTYKAYVISSSKVEESFKYFSFGGFNLRNCIFYNSMLIIPADKRIIFLKTGKTVEKSTVTEKPFGIVNPNSKIMIQYNCLYIQSSNQVYKINLA